jgi:hypothetical protein
MFWFLQVHSVPAAVNYDRFVNTFRELATKRLQVTSAGQEKICVVPLHIGWLLKFVLDAQNHYRHW